jgi:hypothetical protein
MKRVLMASVIAGTFAIATIATPTSAQAQWGRGWGWGLGGLALGLTIGAALSRPLNGSSFIALKDAPGPGPGPGWQLLTCPGKRGVAGEKGERGPQGDRGLSGATIRDWKLDRARYVATPVMSDGGEGPPLELRGLFEQFLLETR